MEGCSPSTGKRIKCFTRGLYDFVDWCQFLSTYPPIAGKTLYLMGHSWGGFIVCNHIVSTCLDFKAVVSFSSFNDELGLLDQLTKVTIVFHPLYKLVFRILYPEIYKMSSVDSLYQRKSQTLCHLHQLQKRE